MERLKTITWSRGRFVRTLLLAPIAYLVAACTGDDAGNATANSTNGGSPTAAPSLPPTAVGGSGGTTAGVATAASGTSAPLPPVQTLVPTPTCADDDDPTPAQTEGPYFTPGSPQRTSLLEARMGGAKLTLTGAVLSTACQPVARALVDFWQCDDQGEYDNRGFRLRGHQFTDAAGRYTLETIVPGVYPGRTRHIHVKVQAPNRAVLTTQLYFPNEPGNARDSIFREECVIDMRDAASGKAGAFDFVLNV